MKMYSLIGSVALFLSTVSHAQSIYTTYAVQDIGKKEFKNNCASCHGLDGKGNGPVVDLLKKAPPDLTQLARKNGGILPVTKIYDTILGDIPLAHGGRDMPIWGHEYRMDAADYYGEMPYDVEAYVRARILHLVEYISRLQKK
jgi:mono/diheme cytochrome c family protein